VLFFDGLNAVNQAWPCMNNRDSDKLAEEALNAYAEFEGHLYEKGIFPMIYFRAFFEAAVRYIEATKESPLIHRNVANAINGLSDLLQLKSSRAPGEAISDADRLECMLFSEHDPYFDGHEPPAP
jgi:hypothetical protein